ncbi:hypothetical protein CYG49_03340, partial [Candidatus Saccharibacteria bacterium]
MYKKEPEIEQRIINANAVSNFLASKGFPARTTVDSRIVQINTPSGNRFASLYGYLPGSTIPWEGYTQDHIKLLGKAMSDMHSHLQDFEVGAIPLFGDEFTPILERMERYFTLKDVQMAMLHKLGVQCPLASIRAMRKLLKELRNVKDQQVLHMDFVRG